MSREEINPWRLDFYYDLRRNSLTSTSIGLRDNLRVRFTITLPFDVDECLKARSHRVKLMSPRVFEKAFLMNRSYAITMLLNKKMSPRVVGPITSIDYNKLFIYVEAAGNGGLLSAGFNQILQLLKEKYENRNNLP